MIKLKKIVCHLSAPVYQSIEDALVKNKADNFLFLLRAYRNSDIKDNEIIQQLDISMNSLYVLKSRLNDKIQEHLSGDIWTNQEDMLKQLHQVPEVLFGASHEVAEAFLLKLEKDLLLHDMHNELLVVYSALKKLNLHSEKYFHYSQLYNRHVAFSLSIEKCEDILGSFNRALAQYNFSRLPKQLDTLLFLNKEISDHFSLNPSQQTELIKHIIELQLAIFCDRQSDDADMEQILHHTQKLISDLPAASVHKSWQPVSDCLFFEYFCKTAQWKQAAAYYERANAHLHTLLLFSPVCMTSHFLMSKLKFLQHQNTEPEPADDVLYDAQDRHSQVLLGIYQAMVCCSKKEYKEGVRHLNDILNTGSFKDFFHINTEIKLSLAYMYIQLRDYDMADSILKNIARKIKSEETDYTNILTLIKVFTTDIKQSNRITQKQKDDFTIFLARNAGSREVLSFLLPELKTRYT